MKKEQRQSKKKVERRTSFNSFHAVVLPTKARRTLLLVERKNGVMMTVIVMQSIYAWMILVSCSALHFLCSTAFGICGIILVFSRKKRKREKNVIWSMKGIEKESKDFFGSFKHRRKHNDVDGNNIFWCGWHWQLVVLYECFDVLSTSFESAKVKAWFANVVGKDIREKW